MSGHLGIPVGVHVVLERDGQILMMRRAGTGFFDGLYSLPGGHVEPGESLGVAGARELLEELGVEVEPRALVMLGVVHRRSDTNRIDFFMRASGWRNEARICEPHKCDDLRWCGIDLLPHDTVAYVRLALNQARVPWILELGWEAGDDHWRPEPRVSGR